MLALFSARAIILSYVTGFLGPHGWMDDRSAFSLLNPTPMNEFENRCELLRTEMLSRVFDLIYGTFWSSRYARYKYADHYARLLVIVQRLAGALYNAPVPDGSSPQVIGACVDRLADEVERLGANRLFPAERLTDMRERMEELREIVAQMTAHCAERAGAETK